MATKPTTDQLEQGNLEFALRRFVRQSQAQSEAAAVSAAQAVGIDVGNAATDGLAEHELKRQFIHGVGALFVAKTKNANQLVDWSEIQNRPDFGDLDYGDITIDAEQIISGIIALARLPVASLGASTPNKLVLANDPRLTAAQVSYPAGEPVSSGDWLRVANVSGTAKVFRADASASDHKAIGYTVESKGTDETVVVYPYGENGFCYLPGVDVSLVGRTLFLGLEPGHATLTPPSATGNLIQPLGTIGRVLSGTMVAAIVRYEYRVIYA